MTQEIDAALAATLAADHSACARVLSLDADGLVRMVWEAPGQVLLTGTVSQDRSRQVRSSCSIELANPDGDLSPAEPGDWFFTGERFRLEQGAYVDGVPFYETLGTFVVSGFGTTMNGHLSITGEDPMWLCQQPFGQVVTITAGTLAEDALRQLLEPVLGDGTDWVLDGGGAAVAAIRSFVEDDDRLTRTVGLMADLGCELFADRSGAPVLQPIPDPTTLESAASYAPDPGEAVVLDLARAGSWLPYNESVVIGEGPGRPSVRGQADITDAKSPFHQNRIGLRVAPIYRSAQIATKDQANAVALNRLIAFVFGQDSITAHLVPDLRIDAGDVIEMTDLISGTNARYWVRSVTHPVTTGSMAISGPFVSALFTAPSNDEGSGDGIDVGTPGTTVGSAIAALIEVGAAVGGVVVSPGTPADSFTRSVTDGWGTSSGGDVWTNDTPNADYDVSGTEGTLVLSATQIHYADLAGVSLQDVTILVKLKFDKVPTGASGEVFGGTLARFLSASANYSGTMSVTALGNIYAHASSAGTDVVAPFATGLTYVAGDYYWVKFQVAGVSPTHLRVKVWKDGSAEPGSWQIDTTSSTAGLQIALPIGIKAKTTGVTNSPIVATFDAFSTTVP